MRANLSMAKRVVKVNSFGLTRPIKDSLWQMSLRVKVSWLGLMEEGMRVNGPMEK